MERRVLGRSGIEVPVIGLGTSKVFNPRTDAGDVRCEAVVDVAVADPPGLLDTSPMYGEAERVLSRALAERRDHAVLATKVWARTRAVGEQQIASALERFDYVDLYLVHNLLAMDDHLPRLRDLRARGQVRALGASHYLPSAYPELLARMRRREVDVVEVPYSPRERTVEREVLDEAERLGIGVIAMMPFASGALLAGGPEPTDLAEFAPFGVVTWPQVLLKWVLSDPRVHAVIPATSSADHMRENQQAGAPPWFTGDERLRVRQLASRLA
jgi:aryl-alcohol dehydrogenase-like predicted oxidoreductase